MSLDERSAIFRKSDELRAAGKKEEALAMSKTCPLSPYLAKIAKEKIGVDYLRNNRLGPKRRRNLDAIGLTGLDGVI
jgi:hypothetical protein